MAFRLPQVAPPELVAARVSTCRRCPLYIALTGQCSPVHVGPLGRRGCGCFIAAKARLLSEACPNGQW